MNAIGRTGDSQPLRPFAADSQRELAETLEQCGAACETWHTIRHVAEQFGNGAKIVKAQGRIMECEMRQIRLRDLLAQSDERRNK